VSDDEHVTMYTNEPPGLIVVRALGVRYLAFDPDFEDPPGSPWANAERTMGWYYGDPRCCVEAFVARDETRRAAHRAWLERQASGTPIHGTPDDPRPEYEPRPGHPISGHLLCRRCEAGPKAPLPPRPAESYGFLLAGDDGEPVFYAPSGYESPERAPVPVVTFEQLALELGPPS
jgi:hypothetical protein